MQLGGSFSCNSVVWIVSLAEEELGPSRRMMAGVSAHCSLHGYLFFMFDVKCRSELCQVLKNINFCARENGLRPILVLDAHGNQQDGLVLDNSGEAMKWNDLGSLLQQINISTCNNLCVIGAACFSLRTISPAKLDKAAPFFVLLAPEQDVKVGFLEDNLPAFFNRLFTGSSLDDAYSSHLSDVFKYFHCEMMLFNVVARYIVAGCKGKRGAERRERLMTEVFMHGMLNTKANRKIVRKKLKASLKPNQTLLDKYAETFLVGRKCSFTMEQLLTFIEKK